MTTRYVDLDIRQDEDFRAQAYADPDSPLAKQLRLPIYKRVDGWAALSGEPWTVGYGCTGEGIVQGTVWTLAQAVAEQVKRRQAREAELDRALPWWRSMCDERQDVLVNMAYNMGVPRLLGFHHALAAMQSANWVDAAAEMLSSEWAGQVGARAKRLARQMVDGFRASATSFGNAATLHVLQEA